MLVNLIKEYGSKEKPVRGNVLASLLGVSKPSIRIEVNKLRREGVPICSNREGYYYSTKPEDIKETIAHLESRTRNIREAIDGIRGGLQIEESKSL
jgi:biotin operon repressor